MYEYTKCEVFWHDYKKVSRKINTSEVSLALFESEPESWPGLLAHTPGLSILPGALEGSQTQE